MAKAIQFENLVPETYIDQSRDFQMFCALLDLAFNSCKHQIESMKYINVPELCPDNYLQYLSHKLGFEYDSNIYSDKLRKILICFKRLVQYKGSLKGINDSVHLFMNIQHSYFKYSVEVNPSQSSINIIVYDQVVENLDILSDILKYIIPCGYVFQYRFVTTIAKAQEFGSAQSAQLIIINTLNNSLITSTKSPYGNGSYRKIETVETNPSYQYPNKNPIINGFNTMQVVEKKSITDWVDSNDNNKHKAVLQETKNNS